MTDHGSIPLSDNEIERLKKAEMAERRKARLVQVRAQERILAKRRRERFQRRVALKENQLVQEKRLEWVSENEEHRRVLLEKYQTALAAIGEAHDGAVTARKELLQAKRGFALEQRKREQLQAIRHEEAIEKTREEQKRSLFNVRRVHGLRRHETASALAEANRSRVQRLQKVKEEKAAEERARKSQFEAASLRRPEVVRVEATVGRSGSNMTDYSKTRYHAKIVKHPTVQLRSHGAFEDARELRQRIEERREEDKAVELRNADKASSRGKAALYEIGKERNKQAVEKDLELYLTLEQHRRRNQAGAMIKSRRQLRQFEAKRKQRLETAARKELEQVVSSSQTLTAAEKQEATSTPEEKVSQVSPKPVIKQAEETENLTPATVFIPTEQPNEKIEVPVEATPSAQKLNDARKVQESRKTDVETRKVEAPSFDTSTDREGLLDSRQQDLSSAVFTESAGRLETLDGRPERPDAELPVQFEDLVDGLTNVAESLEHLSTDPSEIDSETRALLEESRAARRDADVQIREILELGRSSLMRELESSANSNAKVDSESKQPVRQVPRRRIPPGQLPAHEQGDQSGSLSDDYVSVPGESAERAGKQTKPVKVASEATEMGPKDAKAAYQPKSRNEEQIIGESQASSESEIALRRTLDSYSPRTAATEHGATHDEFLRKQQTVQSSRMDEAKPVSRLADDDIVPLRDSQKAKQLEKLSNMQIYAEAAKSAYRIASAAAAAAKAASESYSADDLEKQFGNTLEAYLEQDDSFAGESFASSVGNQTPSKARMEPRRAEGESRSEVQALPSSGFREADRSSGLESSLLSDPSSLEQFPLTPSSSLQESQVGRETVVSTDGEWKANEQLNKLAAQVEDFLKSGSAKKAETGSAAIETVAPRDLDDLLVSSEAWKGDVKLGELASKMEEYLKGTDDENEPRESTSANASLMKNEEEQAASVGSDSVSSYGIDDFEQRLVSVLNTLKSTRLESGTASLPSATSDEALDTSQLRQYPLSDSLSMTSSRSGFTELSVDVKSSVDVSVASEQPTWYDLKVVHETDDENEGEATLGTDVPQSPVFPVETVQMPNVINRSSPAILGSPGVQYDSDLSTNRKDLHTEEHPNNASSPELSPPLTPANMTQSIVSQEQSPDDNMQVGLTTTPASLQQSVENANTTFGSTPQVGQHATLANVVEPFHQEDRSSGHIVQVDISDNATGGGVAFVVQVSPERSEERRAKLVALARRSQLRAQQAKEVARRKEQRRIEAKPEAPVQLEQTSKGSAKNEPSQALLSRLVHGQRDSISAKERKQRTRRLYEKLPEVRKQREEEDRKRQAAERRKKAADLEKRRRARNSAKRKQTS